MIIDFDWPGVLANALWAVIGGTIVFAWRQFGKWRRNRGHRAILAGLESPMMFVFPPRDVVGRTLPQTAIEDFLAINNIISAFLHVGKTPPEKVRDHSHLSESDKKQSTLILICSSRSNRATKDALDILSTNGRYPPDLIPRFEAVHENPSQLYIRWNNAVWPSPSYHQEDKLEDVAIILKAQSPWAGQQKILIVAGVRGIGTWGAAEMLKKWWKDLYDRKGRSRRLGMTKQGDFVAMVSVHYEASDIKRVKLLALEDLDRIDARAGKP